MRKHRVMRNLLIDLVCACLGLVVFALFHHVLPRQQQSLGIVITNPYQTESSERDSGSRLPENAQIIASAGISDARPASATRRCPPGGRRRTAAGETAAAAARAATARAAAR